MKIPSINPTLPVVNHGKNAQTQHRQVYSPNFGATISSAELKKYPLSKKLPFMFSACAVGDVITVGSSFDDVYKGLSKYVAELSDIVRHVFFIRQPNLSVPLAFELNEQGLLSCANIGDKKILMASSDETIELNSMEDAYVEEGDVIIDNQINIPLTTVADYSAYMDDMEDMELVLNPKNFANEMYDCAPIQQDLVAQANKRAIKLLKSGQTVSDDVVTTQDTTEKTKTDKAEHKLSFKDVGGMNSTIETLKRSILYPIKYPFAYNNMSVNKGIILYGKPGTGKTLVAEALAGESDAKFIKLCGTDLESKWVGETEENWRNVFNDAKTNQPSIIFIDEFDAIVKERGNATGENYSDKVVNQLLSLMSDLEKSSDNVFVIATTNKLDSIDSAIKRSGRFGKQIEIPVPDKNGLKSIYEIHARNKNIDSNLDIDKLIDDFYSKGFTGADVKHVVNEAHANAWARYGIYQKMEAGTLVEQDIATLSINREDFDLALKDWEKHQTSKLAKRIGYN